jgi:hypothetical protein
MAALGLGHSLVAGSLLKSAAYTMTKSFEFDGTDDGFITNTVNNSVPANGTTKPTIRSLSVAAWVKFDDGSADPYDTSAAHGIVSCVGNGGWSLSFSNRRFSWHNNLDQGDGTNISVSPISHFRAQRNDGAAARFLFKEDDWHFVVGTTDLENPSTSVIGNIYVDGNRAQAGSTSGGGSGPNGEVFGSQPEDSNSKKTVTASSGDITHRYDTQANRENQKVDIVIGGSGVFTFATSVTTMQTNFWNGYIGDVAIWDCLLSQAEIAQLYNLHRPIDMSTVQTSNLRGYWRPTNGLKDSVSGNTGSLTDDGVVVVNAPSTDVSGYDGYQ